MSPVTKTRSLAIIAESYVVAIGAAAIWLVWGPSTGRFWLDTLVADVIATLVVFMFSRIYRNSSFYDAYWSVIPPLMLFYWWARSSPDIDPLRCWLLAIVVVAWAIRLTGNWAYAFPGLHHEDWRYPMLRERAGRAEFWVDLFAIHLFPTLQVFIGMIPAYVAVTRPDPGIGWLTWLAFVIGIAAVTLEFAADLQLRPFVAHPRLGAALDQGLWSWSRHPNYFGECSFWFAVALFGVAAAPRDAWWLFAGAALMVALFLGASIPMMEKRSLERRPEYQDVIDRVSKFVPRPPRAAR